MRPARRAPRRATCLVALLVLVALPVGHAVPAYELTGEILVSGAIESQGQVQASAFKILAFVTPRLVTAGEPFFAAPRATVTIVEQQTNPFPRHADPEPILEALEVRSPFAPHAETRTLDEVELTLLDRQSPTAWVADSFAGTGRLTIRGSCTVNGTREPLVGSQRWVQGGCGPKEETVEAQMDGTHRWTIDEGKLRLTYHADDGSGTREEIITAGEESADPKVQSKESLKRRFIIETEAAAAGSRLRLPALAVSAPTLVLQGRIAVPESHGRLQWGGADLPSPIRPLGLDGVVAVEGTDSDLLHFSGITTNGPENVTPAGWSPSPGAVGVVAGAVGALLLMFQARWLASAFFTRLTSNKALEHQRRRAILDGVRSNPGCRTTDLAAILGIDRGSVRYHVDVLLQQGLIRLKRVGRETALFEATTLPPENLLVQRRLRRPLAKELLQTLREQPSRTQQELASILGVHQTTVSDILLELRRLGIIEVQGRGPQRKYQVMLAHAAEPAAS